MRRFHNPSRIQLLAIYGLLFIDSNSVFVECQTDQRDQTDQTDQMDQTYRPWAPYDEQLGFNTFNPEPEWQYPFEGWSYYIRATDFHRESARSELGWGQWTSSPTILPPTDPPLNEVCTLNPLDFTCDGGVNSVDLMNCGGDYQTRESCTYGECGSSDVGERVRGTIEGGMGYWPGYTIEKSQVTWMIPGATTGEYNYIGGTMLGDQAVPCRNLGAAVRISNRLLVPNDFVSLEGAPNIDGFLGYMMQRTPIGKRSEKDTANYWTVIIDTANFRGPVLYVSTWFWDLLNWHPKSKSWSNPEVSLEYIARGFEGEIAAMISDFEDANGKKYAKTTQWGLPLDKDSDTHSTLFTGHVQYSEGWLDSLLNDALDGKTDASPDILGASTSARVPKNCFPVDNWDDDEPRLLLEFPGNDIYDSFKIDVGITTVDPTDSDNVNLGCPTKYLLDRSKLDCETEEGICLVSKYFTWEGEAKLPSEVPENVKQNLETEKAFPTHRIDNRRNHGPPKGPERECFENPGPSSPMYCVRTLTESWIGFKWYRFVDQPELTNVFKSMPENERSAAKSYMQARIENLHRFGQDLRWFDPPGGDASLPADKISIDEALLLTPPAGMEFGYVPIPMYQRKKEKPVDCEIVVGAYADEPEPLPSDYYDGFPALYYDRDEVGVLQCAGPEVDGMTNPGVIFPYPSDPAADRLQYAYDVPLPDLTVPDTEMVPFPNPRIELDDSIPNNGSGSFDTGGDKAGAPTPDPTPNPTPAPTLNPTPVPTSRPVSGPSSTCSDNPESFLAVKPGSKGWSKNKTCDGWVKRKSTAWRCLNVAGVKENCPSLCLNCCLDSPISFTLLNSGKTKNCEWAAINPNVRCKKPPTRQVCSNVCGQCDDWQGQAW